MGKDERAVKCEQVQEWIAGYWDMELNDFRKRTVERHIRTCPVCRSEFELWKESTELIRASNEHEPVTAIQSGIANHPTGTAGAVLNRIYMNEEWRRPVVDRSYRISYRAFRRLAASAAFFLAVFIVSFSYSLFSIIPGNHASDELVGLQPVAMIASDHMLHSTDGTLDELAGSVASLTVPMTLTQEPAQSDLNFMLVFSLVGMVTVVLMMNWFSRIRA